MKTFQKILIPLTLLTIVALLTACQKEDLKPSTKSATTRQSNPKETPVVQTFVDPKPMITRTYTEAYEIFPIKNDDDLLQLAADCDDRKDLANRFNFPLEALTIATEIADLKRTGISTDLATTIHAAAYIGILDVVGTKTDFIGIIDLISGKHQTIDIGLLSLMTPKSFYKVVIDFFDNHCTSCEESIRPTYEMIESAINRAQELSARVSYEKEGTCWKSSNNVKTASHRKPMMTRTYLHRKPMITRSYTEAFEILPIQSDQELLALTANCKDRQRIAQQYHISIESLTFATELADLKRTGINLDEASSIHAATYIGIIDLVGGRMENETNRTLDISQLAMIAPEQLHQFIITFMDNYCPDCNRNPLTSFDWIKQLIETAKQLPILVSYEKDGICSQSLTFNSLSQLMPIIPSNNGGTPTLSSYTEAIEILPVDTDEELLALTADCQNRKAIAIHYNMDYEQLTIATEIADLKRTGMCANQAALIQDVYFNGIESFGLDIGIFRNLEVDSFYPKVLVFLKEHPEAYPDDLISSLKEIEEWIQIAQKLTDLVS